MVLCIPNEKTDCDFPMDKWFYVAEPGYEPTVTGCHKDYGYWFIDKVQDRNYFYIRNSYKTSPCNEHFAVFFPCKNKFLSSWSSPLCCYYHIMWLEGGSWKFPSDLGNSYCFLRHQVMLAVLKDWPIKPVTNDIQAQGFLFRLLGFGVCVVSHTYS